MSQQNLINMDSYLEQNNFINQVAENHERIVYFKDKIFSIIDEQIGSKIKFISDRYENQQKNIDQQQDMLKSLLNNAEKILSNFEKQNEQKQTAQAATPKTNQTVAPSINQIGQSKKVGANLLQNSLMGLSTGLPVINEAVPLSSRLPTSISQLPAQANLQKIAKGNLDSRIKAQKALTKESHEEETQKVKQTTEKKEAAKEQLKTIEEAATTTSHPPTHKQGASIHIADNSKIPKIQDLKTLRNINKDKSMAQLKPEESQKQDKSKITENKDLPNKAGHTEAQRKNLQSKKEEKPKQQEDEEKVKIERKPAVPKAGVNHEKTGSDSKNKEKSLKNSASVSQFNSVEPKSGKQDKTTTSKTKQATNKKNEPSAIDQNQPKIIPKKVVKETTDTKSEDQNKEENKQQVQLEEKEKSQSVNEQNEGDKSNTNQSVEQKQQKDLHKHEDDENLLDDIGNHSLQDDADKSQHIQTEEEQAQKTEYEPEVQKEFNQEKFKAMIHDFFEGKISAETIKKFCKDNHQHIEQIDETLIFTQIDLQQIVENFNQKHPDSGNFEEKFKISQNTKEGLQLIDLNFMGEMVDKESLDDLVLQQYELFFFMLDGTDIQQFKQSSNKQQYINEYMTQNHEKFVEILLSLEDKVEQLNKSFEKKLFIKDFVSKHQDIANQDKFYEIEPLCALISPLIEEIINFMGLNEQSSSCSKKGALYFKYQENQQKIKKIADLNQIIVDNTYQNNSE